MTMEELRKAIPLERSPWPMVFGQTERDQVLFEIHQMLRVILLDMVDKSTR